MTVGVASNGISYGRPYIPNGKSCSIRLLSLSWLSHRMGRSSLSRRKAERSKSGMSTLHDWKASSPIFRSRFWAWLYHETEKDWRRAEEAGWARAWDIASGKMIFESRGHGDARINAVALSPDGRMLATGGNDAATRLWRTDTGELLSTFAYAGKWVRTVQFSPDGKTLAVGG